MKRTKPLRRTRWYTGGPDIDREPKPQALTPAVRRGTYAGTTTGPAPKTEPYRDPVLLEMARGRPCLLLVPGICNHRTDTTVACHSNLSIHGKAGARPADDCYTVWGCAACHIPWLDQGPAPAALKAQVFMEAHLLQVLAWRQIAGSLAEPPRFRHAAARALRHLGAIPLLHLQADGSYAP